MPSLPVEMEGTRRFEMARDYLALAPGGETPRWTLRSGEAHVWRANLDLGAGELAGLARTLAPDERARADRFYFARDRDRFVAARGFLRMLLGNYLETAPASVELDYPCRCGRAGCDPERRKPVLRGEAPDGLHFNLSHAGQTALFALTRGRVVGVDLEEVHGTFSVTEIAAQFFSAQEAASLGARPPEEHPSAFFAAWTLKEAYVKARGEGFTFPFDRFTVAFGPDVPPALLQVEGEPQEPARWTLMTLDAGPELAAALAVEGEIDRIVLRDLAR
jgi:4'-phosphopantetheinyl transferase